MYDIDDIMSIEKFIRDTAIKHKSKDGIFLLTINKKNKKIKSQPLTFVKVEGDSVYVPVELTLDLYTGDSKDWYDMFLSPMSGRRIMSPDFIDRFDVVKKGSFNFTKVFLRAFRSNGYVYELEYVPECVKQVLCTPSEYAWSILTEVV